MKTTHQLTRLALPLSAFQFSAFQHVFMKRLILLGAAALLLAGCDDSIQPANESPVWTPRRDTRPPQPGDVWVWYPHYRDPSGQIPAARVTNTVVAVGPDWVRYSNQFGVRREETSNFQIDSRLVRRDKR
jgi:hypothetical protein